MNTRSVQVLLVATVLLASAVWFWAGARFDPDVPFLTGRGPAGWIEYPLPFVASPRPVVPSRTEFRKTFEISNVPAEAPLRIRAFRQFRLNVNGTEVALEDGSDPWKVVREVDVAAHLRPGENTLRVVVTHPSGPPALWLTLDAGPDPLISDAGWTASLLGAATRPAREVGRSSPPPAGVSTAAFDIASHFPGDLAGRDEQPRPLRSLVGSWPRWSLLAALGALAGFWLTGRAASRRARWAPLLLAAVAGAWALMWLHDHPLLTTAHGFDSTAHLDYIAFIQEQGRLPLPDQGWQAFQMPLFYVVAAALLDLLGLGAHQPGAAAALRTLTFLLGLAQVALIFGILRLLFPGRLRRQLFGLALASFLPVHLYLFQYVTNEGFASVLMLTAIYVCLRMIRSEEPSPGKRMLRVALLGGLIGLAVLSKLTAILIVPVVCVILVLDAWRRTGAARALPGTAAVFLVAVVLVCGWRFYQVQAEYGQLVLGGWDAATGASWWQDPGRRDASYFTSLGDALVRPRFSGFDSLGDGMYATLWGDGLEGGSGSLDLRPPWNDDAMAAGYLLALPPAAAILLGFCAATVHWYRRRSLPWLLILGSGFAMAFGLIHLNLNVPYIASPKIFYGLSAMACLCACGGWGLDLLAHRRWSAILVVACLTAWAGNSYLTFWIDGDAPRTAWLLTRSSDPEQSRRGAAALQRQEDVPEAQRYLGRLHASLGDARASATHYESALRWNPRDVASRVGAVGEAGRSLGLDGAIALLEALPPGTPANEAYFKSLGLLYEARGDHDRALEAYRLALGIAPEDADTRARVARMQAARLVRP